MSFLGLADNQCISFNNLQDAVNNGIFTSIASIPVSQQQITKSAAAADIIIPNPNYPPYANKSNNQLLVKSDIYNPGDFILDPNYGISFTSMTGSVGGLPTFTYPVTGGNTTELYNGSIAAQLITVNLGGTLFISPAKIVLYVDSVQVDCQDVTGGGETKTLNLSVTVNSPSTIRIAMNGGSCVSPPTPVPPVFPGKCFSTVAVNRGSGQYMAAGNTNLFNSSGFTQGYLYYSLNYGSTWNQSSLYGYWKKIAYSDNGQYVIAVEAFGKAYLSSNYGVSFTEISGLQYSSDYYNSAALSNDGQYQMIVSGNSDSANTSIVQVSTNYGSTWTTVRGSGFSTYSSCAMDASGSNFLIGGGFSAYIEKSTDFGSTWSFVFTNPSGSSVNDININASNGWAIASQFGTSYAGSYLIKSSNSGSSWSQISGGSAQQSWLRAIVNNTVSGKALYFLGNTGTSYIQQVTGPGPIFLGTVSDLTSSGNRNWHALANSDNGTYVLGGTGNGLYLSTDGGLTWNAL